MKKILLLIMLSTITFASTNAQSKIQQTIKRELNKHKFFDDYEAENSKEYSMYEYNLNVNKKLVLAFATSEYHNYHAAGAFMSVFVLSKSSNNTWRIAEQYIKCTEIGSNGEAPMKDDIEIFNGSEFMITIKGGSMGQGYIEGYITCFYPVLNKIENIGIIDIFYSNEGALEDVVLTWEAEYMFLPSSGGTLPEILLNITGSKDGVTYYDTEYYRFDGQKYVKK